MNKRNKFKSFLYDFFGGILMLLIGFIILFCASNNVRTFTKKAYHAIDSIHATAKPKSTSDSIVSIKKDTIPCIPTPMPTTVVETMDTVPLIKGEDNLYYMKVYVNSIPMRFALDTGCTEMSMSIVEYLFLERQGLIKAHTNQECISLLANGDEEKSFITTIDEVNIGGHIVTNVSCMVSPSQNAHLLLGQKVLSKLGDVTIRYSQNILLISKE